MGLSGNKTSQMHVSRVGIGSSTQTVSLPSAPTGILVPSLANVTIARSQNGLEVFLTTTS